MHRISRRKKLDPVHAMLLGNLLWGIGLGITFSLGVYALNLGNIRTLVSHSPDGVLAMALLTAGGIITFASVVMGGAIMLLPQDEGRQPPRGGRGMLLRALVPVRVAVPQRAASGMRRGA